MELSSLGEGKPCEQPVMPWAGEWIKLTHHVKVKCEDFGPNNVIDLKPWKTKFLN
jgi:hypothetical protein